jgi:hypothetical protein
VAPLPLAPLALASLAPLVTGQPLRPYTGNLYAAKNHGPGQFLSRALTLAWPQPPSVQQMPRAGASFRPARRRRPVPEARDAVGPSSGSSGSSWNTWAADIRAAAVIYATSD